MNNEKSLSKGPLLRSLVQDGVTEVRIVTTRQDWETRKIGVGEQAGLAVGLSLVSFPAESFREVSQGSDIWNFQVKEGAERFSVYIAGDEIFMIYVPSALS